MLKWFETKTLKINVLRLPPLQGEGRGGVIIDQIELNNINWYDSDQSLNNFPNSTKNTF
jgi:hypothetical protein